MMTVKCTSPEGHKWKLIVCGGLNSPPWVIAECQRKKCPAQMHVVDAEAILNEHTSLTKKVERLLDGIKRARQIVYSLDCECDEAEGYTCTIHDDRKLFDALLESE